MGEDEIMYFFKGKGFFSSKEFSSVNEEKYDSVFIIKKGQTKTLNIKKDNIYT